MQIRVLGASGGAAPGRPPTCFLVDGRLAVDAGALAERLPIEEQHRVRDVLLTHSHLDHVRDLPFILINTFRDGDPLRLWSTRVTLDAVRTHLLNKQIWYEAFTLPSEEAPSITGNELEVGVEATVAGHRVLGFALPHTVPSTGWLVGDGTDAVYFAGDTSDDDCLRPVVKAAGKRLRGAFLEASFPDERADFAILTGHLTPAGVGRAARALPPDVPVFVTHMKPGSEETIERQLADLGDPRIRPARAGDVIDL